MWKHAALVAIAVATGGCAGSGDDGTRTKPAPAPTPPPPTAAAANDDLERARKLIRDCRVRSTVSSPESGAVYLELKNGSFVDIDVANEQVIYAEIQRAMDRCGPVARGIP